MRWTPSLTALASVVCLLLAAGAASADSVLVDLTQYGTGSRSAGTTAEMIVTGNWVSQPWVTVAWDITLENGVFTYIYTVSRDTESAEISHFDIEVSPGFTTADIISWTGGTGVELGDPFWSNLSQSAGSVLKFEGGATETETGWTATYTLVTRRVPIWGDFLMKDGKLNGGFTLGYNPGFGTDPTTDFTNWIPTPDTAYLVPLPPAVFSGLGLLGGLALLHLRRRRSRA
jgi:hypothetical protein